MSDEYQQILQKNSKILRKGMTEEEKHLWYDFLKKIEIPVHRQKIFGRYIVDFYIPKAKIVIEIDGFQHGEPKHAEADRIRDEYLNSLGLQVLRYQNKDIILHFKWICEDIQFPLRNKQINI